MERAVDKLASPDTLSLVSVERAVDKLASPDTLLLVSLERAVVRLTSPDTLLLVSVERSMDRLASPDTLSLVSVERATEIFVPFTTMLLQEPSLKYKLCTCKSTYPPDMSMLFPLKSELEPVYWRA